MGTVPPPASLTVPELGIVPNVVLATVCPGGGVVEASRYWTTSTGRVAAALAEAPPEATASGKVTFSVLKVPPKMRALLFR